MEGFWSGLYNGKEDTLQYLELFEEVSLRNVYPTLIIWEVHEVFEWEVKDNKYGGSQIVRTKKIQNNENKFIYEETEEDNFDYSEYLRQNSDYSDGGREKGKVKDDEWKCEKWGKINNMNNYYWMKWFKDNDILKELYYQK